MSEWFLKHIPKLSLQLALCNLIHKFVRKICNLQRSVRKYKKLANECKRNHMNIEHGNINTNALSVSTIKRRVQYCTNVINKVNETVGNGIDIREHYLLNEFRVNPHIFNCVKPLLYRDWSREYNCEIKELEKSQDYAIKLALIGVIRSWSENQWKTFNKWVKFHFVYV